RTRGCHGLAARHSYHYTLCAEKNPGEEHIMQMKTARLVRVGVCCALAATSLMAQDTQANAPGQPDAQQVQRRPQSNKWKLALKTKVVVILAGTNDIAGNTGRSTQEMIQDNIISMIDLAEFNKIRVVLLSVLPAYDYWWQPGMEPAEKIVALNAWLKEYAAKRGVVYVDCHTPMSDEKHGMKKEFSPDG